MGRRFAVLSMCIILALCLAACGNAATETAQTGEAPQASPVPTASPLAEAAVGDCRVVTPYMIEADMAGNSALSDGDGVYKYAATALSFSDEIPEITLSESTVFVSGPNNPSRTRFGVYDLSFKLVDDFDDISQLQWLDSGEYYCVKGIYGFDGSSVDCIFRLAVDGSGSAEAYRPGEIHDLVSASFSLGGEAHSVYDEASLRWLEERLNTAEECYGTGCPFGSVLTMERRDGTRISCSPALDSCAIIYADGKYYDYGSGNEELMAMFSP